jgi:hypothetical protein
LAKSRGAVEQRIMHYGRLQWFARWEIYGEKCTLSEEPERGRTLKGIHRCLKRYIIRELYPLILENLSAAQTSC